MEEYAMIYNAFPQLFSQTQRTGVPLNILSKLPDLELVIHFRGKCHMPTNAKPPITMGMKITSMLQNIN